MVFIEVKVLKKRSENVYRHIRLLPSLIDLFKEFYEGRLSGQIFKMSVHTVQRAIQKFSVENLTTHSFRHSVISYYLDSGLSVIQTSQLVKVSNKVVDTYCHLDTRRMLKKLF